MLLQPILLGLAMAVQSVLGAPAADTSSIEARKVIGHNKVASFRETVPRTTQGNLILKFKPYLKVFNGCVPFSAVDGAGNVGGGLQTSGSSNGGCSHSTGQVYARATKYKQYYAIMYSWYMPKDSPSDGLGHRHDWEEAIVWLSSDNANAKLVALSVSAHGGITTMRNPPTRGTHPLVGYVSDWPLNHQLIQTTQVGGMQPLITWGSLPNAARNALQTANFGKATVPFKDSTYQGNLAKGYAGLH